MRQKQKVKNLNEYKIRKKNRNKKRKYKKTIKYFLFVAPVITIIIINLCGNAVVSNYKYEINYLKKELRKKEIALDELKIKQLEYGSITKVEEKAKEKLNMYYPNESQIRYIDMGN